MYVPPSVMSNVVLFQYSDGALFVTLVSDISSSKAQWRLPSTLVNRAQTSLPALESALARSLGLRNDDIAYREQLYTSESTSGAHSTVCISYMYLSHDTRWHKGTHQVGIFPITKLPHLSQFDKTIIDYAHTRLHAKALYSTILSYLLPKTFDLTQLQLAFETVTQQKVDKRNFRKKITQLDILTAASKSTSRTEPLLYSFKDTSLAFLSKPFPPKSTKA